jgi:hypothetical protein
MSAPPHDREPNASAARRAGAWAGADQTPTGDERQAPRWRAACFRIAQRSESSDGVVADGPDSSKGGRGSWP